MADLLSHFVHVEGRETTTATWLKLCVAVVAVAIGLIIYKAVIAGLGGLFLDPFWSFVSLAVLSAGIYYCALALLRSAARRRTT